ncbi:MAG TPA: hypothetical protein DCL53_04905 [Thauera sp.]|nr:hypothetical protein [Thauera sp.]
MVRMIISGYTDSEDIIAGINDAGICQYTLTRLVVVTMAVFRPAAFASPSRRATPGRISTRPAITASV